MRLSMGLLAVSCVLIGLCAPVIVGALAPTLSSVTGLPEAQVQAHLASATGSLWFVVLAAVGLIFLTIVLAGLRRWLLADRAVEEHGTWDCGYAQPTSRMQYTASSFAQPLTGIFRLFLRTRSRVSPVHGLFPRAASLATETADVCSVYLYRPVFAGIGRVLSSLRWLQHGQVHLYILYVAVTLLVLLVWRLG